MKVIDGDFKRGKEERPLVDKLAEATAQLLQSTTTKGNFILMVETDEGQVMIASDLYADEINYRLDILKYNIISGSFAQGTIH